MIKNTLCTIGAGLFIAFGLSSFEGKPKCDITATPQSGCTGCSCRCAACNGNIAAPEPPSMSYVTTPSVQYDKVFDVVEQMPAFPGGMSELMAWFKDNLVYPEAAARDGIQGRAIVQFVVEKDGSISNVKIAKSVELSIDREAARLVKNMPRWIPGMQNGTPVRVKYTVPVTFKLPVTTSEDSSIDGIKR